MAQSENWIKQIAVGESTYDIAVQNGITFTKTGSDPITWDGTADLTVAIPTLADIVTSPVVFAGTVAADDTISWAQGYQAPAQKGYLVYITAACSFAGQACEPGDMAVYDGTAWRVVSGENQWSFGNGSTDGDRTIIKVGFETKDILTIEGKTLALSLPLVVAKNSASTELSLENATLETAAVYLRLSQSAGSSVDVADAGHSISIPTALASGAVTLANNTVLTSADFTFTQGSLPSATKNADVISATVTNNMSVSGTFVTELSAIKGVAIVDAASADAGSFGFVSGLSVSDGAAFVSGIHAYDATKDEGKTADLTLWGAVSAAAANNTFATGWDAEAASGEVLSAVTVGAVSVSTDGSDLVRGLDGNASSVITSVSFGSAVSSAEVSWFYSGLQDGGTDVVTDVTIGAVSLESDSSSSFAGSAMTGASVSNHVLSFSTGSFMQPVKLSKTADSITKKGFVKSGVSLTGFGSSSASILKGGIAQAATTFSYKSLATGAVTLTQASTSYFFDKANSASYSALMSYKKLSLTDATFSTGSPELTNTTITATIPANTVVTDFSAGSLPSLTIAAPTTTITGSVGTELTFGEEISWTGVDPEKSVISIAGAYTLVSVDPCNDTTGAVIAAANSTYALSGSAKALIPSDAFVTDVTFAS